MKKYHIEHIALDFTFQNASQSLSGEVVNTYEAHKEHAEIFIQSETDIAFSSVEILNWFFLQSQTTIEDHLPKDITHPVLVTFPISFELGRFYMHTTNGIQDLSHLKLMCKVSLFDREA